MGTIEFVDTTDYQRFIGVIVNVEHLSGRWLNLISGWQGNGRAGVTSPGQVDTNNPHARVLFLRKGSFIQAQISDRFPEGIGVPANDADAIAEAFVRIPR